MRVIRMDIKLDIHHIYILDTSYQIGQRYHMAMPTPLDCNALPNIKFSEFTSTFLSVTAKYIE